MSPADLNSDYAHAGFGGQLAFGLRPALLIIDVVTAYLDPASPLYAGAEDALASNVRLAAAARAAGLPVIFTNVLYEPGGRDGGIFFKKVPALKAFVVGSPLGAFHADLTPQEGDMVVSKQYPSAFFGTPLASTLRALNIDTVLVTGFSTSGCVRASALDALQNGFAPFVVEEACADRDPAVQAANLFDIRQKIGEVIDEAQALKLVSQFAARPNP
ncbi:isochorismatase family protein [Caulobacter sp.]|uniref:isochorismatase family protein n=1 Tax=Caulobacter sp. TaxID=78 RepID=UPI003BA86CC7